MSSVPQIEQSGRAMPRSSNVIFGRMDFMSVLLRAIGGELYKIRRRTMSEVLSTIAILVVLLGMAIIALPAIIAQTTPIESYIPQQCSSSGSSNDVQQQCSNHQPTTAELAQAQQSKQKAVEARLEPLKLPGALTYLTSIVSFTSIILLMILTGTVVGGEYSIGTIRLLLTRGPTRTQYLLAKVGAILICILLACLLLTAIGLIENTLFGLMLGATFNVSLLSGTWLLHVISYVFIGILGTFVYAMMALFLATMGKSSAAGMAGALIWWFLESVIGGILTLLALSNKGPFSDLLKAIPDYFIGKNLSALFSNQYAYLNGGPPSALPDWHALLVLTAYLVAFIGLAWWVNQKRDITN